MNDNRKITYVKYLTVVKLLVKEGAVMKKTYEVSELGNMLIYQNEKGDTKVDVYFFEKDIWMNQAAIAQMYNTTSQNITMHIKNIYKDGELDEDSTCKEFLQVQTEGTRQIKRNKKHYNFRMILAIGYRVRSNVGVHFRNWASEILEEYTRKGFAMNDERLKNPKQFGEDYFDELLERIRDIRASEKVFYRQILDIYATSIDYDPKAEISIDFFKKVQNKIHYAVHGQTAAEVIYNRADSEKEFMGLTSFKGSRPHLSDAKIAKNYLDEKELRSLGQLVSGYLDFAERQAEREQTMTMKDWSEHLDRILTMSGEQLLVGAGSISNSQAIDKATEEYKKYQQKTLSQVEQDYLDTIKMIENKTSHKN